MTFVRIIAYIGQAALLAAFLYFLMLGAVCGVVLLDWSN